MTPAEKSIYDNVFCFNTQCKLNSQMRNVDVCERFYPVVCAEPSVCTDDIKSMEEIKFSILTNSCIQYTQTQSKVILYQ